MVAHRMSAGGNSVPQSEVISDNEPVTVRLHTVCAARLVTGWSLIVGTSCGAGLDSVPADFVRDVRPVFARSCVSCHGSQNQKGGLRLDRREDAVKGGDPGPPWVACRAEDSLLIQLVEGRHAEIERMPRKKGPLSTSEVDPLRRWIDEGAVWPDGV